MYVHKKLKTHLIISLTKACTQSCVMARLGVTPTLRLYHKNVIDHYENPRNVGYMEKSDKNVGTGLVGAPACGDVMQLHIRVGNDGKIKDTKFKTFGCGSAIASSSLASEWIKNKTLDDALAITNSEIAKELKLPPVKLHCSMLAADAIAAAVNNFYTKQEKNKETGCETSVN